MTRAQLLARSVVALGAARAGRSEPGLSLAPSSLRLLAVLIVLAFLVVDLSVDVWLPGADTDAADPPALLSDADVPGLTPLPLAVGASRDREDQPGSAPLNLAHPLRAPPLAGPSA